VRYKAGRHFRPLAHALCTPADDRQRPLHLCRTPHTAHSALHCTLHLHTISHSFSFSFLSHPLTGSQLGAAWNTHLHTCTPHRHTLWATRVVIDFTPLGQAGYTLHTHCTSPLSPPHRPHTTTFLWQLSGYRPLCTPRFPCTACTPTSGKASNRQLGGRNVVSFLHWWASPPPHTCTTTPDPEAGGLRRRPAGPPPLGHLTTLHPKGTPPPPPPPPPTPHLL